MNEMAWWIKGIVILILGALGVLLYFSAAAFFNVWIVPFMQELAPEQAHRSIGPVLVLISFVAALIAAFFSVFLYEMIGGGRPLLMGVLFALPMILIQVYVLTGARLELAMLSIHLVEMVGIVAAYLLIAFFGRWVHRRFFATGPKRDD